MVGLDCVTQMPGVKNDLEVAMGTEEEAAHHTPDLPWAQGPMGAYTRGNMEQEGGGRKLEEESYRGVCVPGNEWAGMPTPDVPIPSSLQVHCAQLFFSVQARPPGSNPNTAAGLRAPTHPACPQRPRPILLGPHGLPSGPKGQQGEGSPPSCSAMGAGGEQQGQESAGRRVASLPGTLRVLPLLWLGLKSGPRSLPLVEGGRREGEGLAGPGDT